MNVLILLGAVYMINVLFFRPKTQSKKEKTIPPIRAVDSSTLILTKSIPYNPSEHEHYSHIVTLNSLMHAMFYASLQQEKRLDGGYNWHKAKGWWQKQHEKLFIYQYR